MGTCLISSGAGLRPVALALASIFRPGMVFRYLGLVLLALAPVWRAAAAEAVPAAAFESIDVAPVWAGHPVRFAIETGERFQYVAFYDDERRMTVAQRPLGETEWRFKRLPSRLGWDSHNYIAMAVDAAGFIHISGNMHGDPLVYFRSAAPHDIELFEKLGMVGAREKKVTYPQFVRGAGDRLFFLYRDGKSGNGVRIVNAYDPERREWRRLLDRPLLDGGGDESAYPVGPVLGPDGLFHLVWMWRETPSGATNHDLSYARSRDLAQWETASGLPLQLPIRPGVEEALVDPVSSGGGLAGIAFGVGWDAEHRPIVTYSKYDSEGASQAYNSRWTEQGWSRVAVSEWSYRWDLAKTGTLQEEIVVRPPRLDDAGRLVQEFRHVEEGAGIWVLDEDSLTPASVLPVADDLERLRVPEAQTPGMEVREFIFDRDGEYFLRWETLPIHRDRPRKRPFPEPSMLRVLRKADLSRLPGESSAGVAPPAGERGAETESSLPDGEALEAGETRIGAIVIEVGNIFDESDPTEDKKVFRMANRMRRKTREEVIRRELLFQSGDAYSERLLEESERLLRSRNYLYEAQIEPVRYRRARDGEAGEVDVVVRTRDVWTLTGGAAFSRSGGENSTRFHVEDTNFLGTGKEVGISRESNVDRSGFEFQYRDFNLLASRAELQVVLQENSDGYRRLLKLRRPFYSLDSRRSQGFSLLTEDRIDPLFDRGEVTSEFGHRIDQFTADWGFSRGLHNGRTRRWTLGFTFLRDRFFEAPDRPPIAELPPDRTTSYPWVGFDWVQDRFIEAMDIDKIARVEDLNLGTAFSLRAGWSAPAFGGDVSEALVGFDVSSGMYLGEGRLMLLEGTGGTRWSSAGFANASLRGEARYYRRNFGRHVFFAEIQAAAVENLDAEQQLLIGGDSGLRGYPLRFQSGDRRLLLSLEQRFYSKREVFKLARFGAAFFFDIGQAWFAGGGGDDLGVLKDAGFGLRLMPTRSSGKTVLHVDVAFPFDAGGSIDSVQYLITTKETL